MSMDKKTFPTEPPYRKCSICNDKKGELTDQYCLDNPKHPNYEYDYEDNLTYLDCWNFIRSNESKKEYEERMSKRFNKV